MSGDGCSIRETRLACHQWCSLSPRRLEPAKPLARHRRVRDNSGADRCRHGGLKLSDEWPDGAAAKAAPETAAKREGAAARAAPAAAQPRAKLAPESGAKPAETTARAAPADEQPAPQPAWYH